MAIITIPYAVADFKEMRERGFLEYAREHDLPNVYILIDEYDYFTNQLLTAYNDPLYEQVTTSDSFLRTFFKVIKKGIDEGSIRTCFCTGVLPATMDDPTYFFKNFAISNRVPKKSHRSKPMQQLQTTNFHFTGYVPISSIFTRIRAKSAGKYKYKSSL